MRRWRIAHTTLDGSRCATGAPYAARDEPWAPFNLKRKQLGKTTLARMILNRKGDLEKTHVARFDQAP